MKGISSRVRKILEEGKIVEYYDYHISHVLSMTFTLEFEGREYDYNYYANYFDEDTLYRRDPDYALSANDSSITRSEIREIFLKRKDVRSIIIKYLLKGGEERW